MSRNSKNSWRRLAASGAVLLGMVGGCCHTSCGDSCGWGGGLKGHFANKPIKEGGLRDPGQNPEALGMSLNAWMDEHANRGEANDFTIYLNEWYMGGTALGPYGLHHLGNIVRRLPEVPFPIVLEPHLDSALNETRRKCVVDALLAQGVGDAEQRVAIAYPQAEGLYGEEGEIIFYDMFLNRSGYNVNNSLYGGGRGRSMGAWGGNGFGAGRGGFGNNGFGGGWGGGGGYGGYGGYGRGGYGVGGAYGPGGYSTGGYFGDGYIR